MQPYQVLGVESSASAEEIKRAFRAIAKECHPDRHPGDAERAERFKLARAAYEVLIDPERRAVVDRELERQRAQRRSATDAFYRHTGKSKPEDEQAKKGSPPPSTGTSRGATPPPVRPTQGSDVQARATVSADVAADGGTCEVIYARLRPMPGWTSASRGRSTERVQEHTVIDIPPGTVDGATLRFSSLGNAGQNGGPNGDLLVRVRVQPAVRSRNPGASTPPRPLPPVQVVISAFTAMIGEHRTIETAQGAFHVTIPPGTSPGSVLPSSRAGQAGPEVVVQVHIPAIVEADVRSWVQALADRVANGPPPGDQRQ